MITSHCSFHLNCLLCSVTFQRLSGVNFIITMKEESVLQKFESNF